MQKLIDIFEELQYSTVAECQPEYIKKLAKASANETKKIAIEFAMFSSINKENGYEDSFNNYINDIYGKCNFG